MGFTLTPTSVSRLMGVHPKLASVVRRAASLSDQEFIVVEGLRSHEAMCVNWGRGRTPQQCLSAGVPTTYAQPDLAKVTWLADPFNSNHRMMWDGWGHAVDLGALVDGKYDGATVSRYDVIAAAMFKAASIEGTHVRWGGDFDGDGHWHEHGETDLAHFELVT